MSEDARPSWSEFEKVREESIERRLRIKDLESQLKELKSSYEDQIKAISDERDKAVSEVAEIREAYEAFTNQDEQYQTILSLRSEIRERDLLEAVASIPGIEFQQGVTFEELVKAAGVELPGLDDEIPDDFASSLVESARKNKPYLFAQSASGEATATEAPGAQDETATRPAVKAFGAQAVGGGAAPPQAKQDPAKSVDWTNPAAVVAYAQQRQADRN